MTAATIEKPVDDQPTEPPAETPAAPAKRPATKPGLIGTDTAAAARKEIDDKVAAAKADTGKIAAKATRRTRGTAVPATAPATPAKPKASGGQHISTTHGQLYGALELMNRIIFSRPAVPVLAGVLISVDQFGYAYVECFDYEIHVRAEIGHTDSPAGSALVDRKLFTGMVQAAMKGSSRAVMSEKHVSLIIMAKVVVMSIAGFSYELPLMPAQDYPEMPDYGDQQSITISRDAMLTAATRLSVIAGRDMTLPALTGIHMATVDHGLELMATDRFRLGVDWVPVVEDGGPVSLLMPAKPLGSILKALPLGPATMRWSESATVKGYVRFSSGALTVGIREIDAQVNPASMHKVIAGAATCEVLIDRRQLDTAVRRVVPAAVALGKAGTMKLSFRQQGDSTTAKISAGELDEDGKAMSPPLPIQVAGDLPDWSFPFNYRYLLEVLSLFRADSLAIRIIAKDRQIILAEPGRLDDTRTFRAAVMPKRQNA